MPSYRRPSILFPIFNRHGSMKEVYKEQWDGSYGTSPRVNGKIVLKTNRCQLKHWRLTGYSNNPGVYGYLISLDGATSGLTPTTFAHADNMAYARWRGKLHKGGAALGVSLAGWRQSRSMIVDRVKKLNSALDSTITTLQKHPSKAARLRKKHRRKELLADDVLEYKFGWAPLFEDIHAAMNTVVSEAIPPEWVRGRGKDVEVRKTHYNNGSVISVTEAYFTLTTTYGAKVLIKNENLWLLNRMGLINPATVAWDLVPWSFVVNMFVNVNSMIGCVTDTVGLEVTDHNITRTWKLLQSDSKVGIGGYDLGASASSNQFVTYKERTIGVPLKPVLAVRVPELNWELATTAAALALQKFKTIGRLIGL